MLRSLSSPDAFARALTERRIYLGGFTGEVTAVIEALQRAPIRGADALVTTNVVPPINTIDLTTVVPDGRVETTFVTAALADGFRRGRVAFRPMNYSALHRELTERTFDLAVVRVSPPRDGRVSFGLSHDFAPALTAGRSKLAAMIDPETPFVADGMTAPLDRFDVLIDGPSPPIGLPDDPVRAELEQIAVHVAGLVRDGDTVQTGIGTAPNAVLRALSSHKQLAMHTGMVSDAALDLLDAGALGHITTGVALCSAAWRKRLETDARVRFRAVDQTHGAQALAAVPRLVAINSAIEIDLYGQSNGEMLAGRQISGQGGVCDYIRGARLSAGGRSIICLGASGQRGQVSRIVPSLSAGTPVAITRGDIDHVVTEHGVADLRDTDIDTRAARLIAIAAPAFRASLADAWDRLRRAM